MNPGLVRNPSPAPSGSGHPPVPAAGLATVLVTDAQGPGAPTSVPVAASAAAAAALGGRGTRRSEGDSSGGDLGIPQQPPTRQDVRESGPNNTPPHQNLSRESLEPLQPGDGTEYVWKEWQSWKLRLDWLLFLLFLSLGGCGSVFGLAWYSRVHSGFSRLGAPPGFISENPELMRAIWAQGWLYTALPVSLMTLYRTLWEGVVAAVAERQPYVELMRQGGGAPEKTVLLDYRAEWSITVPFKAMRMGHYFLGLCMAMSVVSSFGLVPATAFLFTTQTSSPVYTVPLRSVSELNYSAIHQPAPGVPSGQKALDWAAATSLMSAPPMAWTNGTNAYSAFELARDLPTSETADQTPISVESTAYFLQPNCVVLREGVDFTSTLQRAAIPGLNGVHLSARGSDRGCGFDYTLLFDLRESFFTKFQPMAAKTFQTINCKSRSTESRVALIAGRYVGDRIDDHSVSNVSLVSCNPRYWALPGVLNATVALSSSGAVPPTSIDGFSGDWSRAVEYTQGDHLYIEASFLDPLAFDPTLPIQVPTNELARHVFELALQSNTDAPLDPVALTKSMSALLERAYTAMAATMLSVPMAHPTSQLGFVTVSETRVVVVQGVAYFVMVVLGLTALLLIWITLSVRHESAALFEEPVGLISIAGIAQRSADLTREVGTLNAGSGFRGEFREAALSSAAFKSTMWAYDQTEKHIYDSNKSGLRTARP